MNTKPTLGCTKGELKFIYDRENDDFHIYAQPEKARSTYLAHIDTEADAQLIVSAWNACQEINPENPLAAAEQIKAMYKVCKYLSEHGWNGYVTDDARQAQRSHHENPRRQTPNIRREPLRTE